MPRVGVDLGNVHQLAEIETETRAGAAGARKEVGARLILIGGKYAVIQSSKAHRIWVQLTDQQQPFGLRCRIILQRTRHSIETELAGAGRIVIDSDGHLRESVWARTQDRHNSECNT